MRRSTKMLENALAHVWTEMRSLPRRADRL